MDASQIRIRPRPRQPAIEVVLHPSDLPGDLPADGPSDVHLESHTTETGTEACSDTHPRERVADADFGVRIRQSGQQTGGKFDVPGLLAVITLAVVASLLVTNPIVAGLAFAVAGGCGTHLLLGRPVFKLARGLAAEGHRLRAAMTCPYCRDHLPEDAAMVCDRTGCGTFYHEECWEECRHSYGGCAIYGCGSSTGHMVGRFALQRRVIRLLVAAALFTPKFVKRLREGERQSFGDVWRTSRAVQRRISANLGETVLVGLVNLVVTCLILGGATVLLGRKPEGLEMVFFMSAIVVLPVLLMRFPLASHFAWFASKLLGSVFRDELAALSRADEGTFLARLTSYAGKKE